FMALLVLGVSEILFNPDATYSILGALKQFAYFFCYVMGLSLVEAENTKDPSDIAILQKRFYWISIMVAVGLLIHYALNWVNNYNVYEGRDTIDFWTDVPMAATGQAAIACIPLSIAIACIFMPTNRWIKLASWATVAVVLGYNLILAGRTAFLITGILLLIAFAHYFLKIKNGRFRLILLLLLVIAIVAILYATDTFGIRTMIEDSQFYARFFSDRSNQRLDEDQRLGRKWEYLLNMWQYPFGGKHLLGQFGYAHDIYFDTYDEAGIFGFLAVVAFMANSVGHFLKCVKDPSLPFAFRQMVLCIYVAIYIIFFLEPVLQGMPWLFTSFCVIDGCISRMLTLHRPTPKRQMRCTA
ncbi:MAG: hypothetical protein IJP14_02040, partial [Clostridia bacterium]|nr:hypothetical protein [Clostridia bacterium]